jgi:hypothetical protein
MIETTQIPTLFIYTARDFGGIPIGTLSPDEAAMNNPAVLETWNKTLGLIGIEPEDDDYDGPPLIVGSVFEYEMVKGGTFRYMVSWVDDSPTILLHKGDIARFLKVSGKTFLDEYQDMVWVELRNVALWFQFEYDLGLPFLLTMLIKEVGMEVDERGLYFRLGQMACACVYRNQEKGNQSLRLCFRKDLPTLMDGMEIAKKKPGNASMTGFADVYLAREGQLYPAQVLPFAATQHRINGLSNYMEHYQQAKGYISLLAWKLMPYCQRTLS